MRVEINWDTSPEKLLDKALVECTGMRAPEDTSDYEAQAYAAFGPKIHWRDCRKQVEEHGILWDDFIRDKGMQVYYMTRVLCAWLGY